MNVAAMARAGLCAVLLGSPAAWAHADADTASLADWPWDVAAALLIATLLYTRGIARLRDKSEAEFRGRHWAFYAGLAAVFAALLTPLDAISEHVFAVHQVQHLLLRGVAPLLLMLAVPSGPLIAGLPVVLRRRLAAVLPRGVRPAAATLGHAVSHPLGDARCTIFANVPLGDAIARVRPGERVPLDGVVLKGQSAVAQARVTGESIPVDKGVGDAVFAGTINQSATVQIRVTALASNSTLVRIIHAVEHGARQPRADAALRRPLRRGLHTHAH